MPKGGGIFFNRKLTAFQQALHMLKERLSHLESRIEQQLSDNRRNLLEFAELSEKMRRTYLRLSRIVKVDSPPSSEEETESSADPEENSDPRAIRDAINKQLNL